MHCLFKALVLAGVATLPVGCGEQEPLAASHALSTENLTIKHPATDLHPRMISELVGAGVRRDIRQNELVSLKYLEW